LITRPTPQPEIWTIGQKKFLRSTTASLFQPEATPVAKSAISVRFTTDQTNRWIFEPF